MAWRVLLPDTRVAATEREARETWSGVAARFTKDSRFPEEGVTALTLMRTAFEGNGTLKLLPVFDSSCHTSSFGLPADSPWVRDLWPCFSQQVGRRGMRDLPHLPMRSEDASWLADIDMFTARAFSHLTLRLLMCHQTSYLPK